MRNVPLLILLSILISRPVFSQEAKLSNQDKLKAVAFLIGNWEGTGWISSGENQVIHFQQTEKVNFALDSTLLIVEGKAVQKEDSTGAVRSVHHALGIVSYSRQENKYFLRAYTAEGQASDSELELTDPQGFKWELEVPGGQIRYTMQINEKGQWHETGEFSRNGMPWYKILEMTLTRVSN